MNKDSLLIILSALALAGCQKNEMDAESVGNGIIKFSPSVAGAGIVTKSQSASAETLDVTLTSEDGTMSIPMTCASSEGISLGTVSSESIATKGELINEFGPGAQPFDTDESFVVKAWDASTSDNIIPGSTSGAYQTVTYSTSDSKWSTSENYYWNEGETKTFYAYSNLPSSGASIANTTAASQTLTYTVHSTASAHTDILMGSCTSDGKSGNPATMTGTASILFSHPLTAVQFKLGIIDGVTSFAVNSISIEGVYASGTAVMTPATASQSDPKDRFTWNPSGTKTVSQSIETQPAAGAMIGEAFLLIPQSFESTSTARIKVSCEIDGVTANLYHPLTIGNWKAGYTNTYILGFGSNLDFNLTVTGEVLTNYQAVGTKQYSVNSNASWKIQYTTDNGSTWNDAVANTLINDWIKFDVVCGDGDDEEQIVNAEVAEISVPTTVSTDHSEILQSATPKGTADAPYDLSMHTIYGESRAAGKPVTANSYVINSSGWYAFPLVYGNAIDYTKNTIDGINIEAYNPTPYFVETMQSNPYYGMLKPFKSATGDITSPFITGAIGAYPLWEDLPDYAIISNNSTDCKVISPDEASTMGLTLGGRCGYVIFHVNNENLDQGNAVIAVRDSEGTILWSWHIWVTDDDLTCKVVTNNRGTFNKGMMPMNLGWVDFGSSKSVYEGRSLQIRFVQMDGDNIKNEVYKTPRREEYIISGGVAGQCPFYQWGRKDPFIRAQGLDNNDEILSGNYSGSFIDTSRQATADSGCDVSFSVKNPNYFVRERESLYGYWYSSGEYHNLWDAKQNTETVSTGCEEGFESSPYKTVYDPCPPGFQVPQRDAFNGFSKNDKKIYDSSGTRILAYDFNTNTTGNSTILFPMTGARSVSTGSIYGLENYYYTACWTAVDFGGNAYMGSSLLIIPSAGAFFTDYFTQIATGCPVRPVEE